MAAKAISLENKSRVPPKFTAAAIAVFLALTFGAANSASQCVTATGDPDPAKPKFGAPNPDPINITKPGSEPAQAAAVGGGAEIEIWVYPTNAATTDPCNIQWAVNNVAKGGTLLLKQYAKNTKVHTDFNFGKPAFVKAPDGTVSHTGPLLRVNILSDLTIKGEFNSRESGTRGVKEKDGTTVWGGNFTFYIGSKVPPVKPSVSIKDIRFDGAAPGPLKFNAGQGYNEVSGCSIVNYEWGQIVGGTTTGAFPIIAHPGKDPSDPSLLTGTFKIEHNFIGAPVPSPNLNNIMHISNANLDLTISDNMIEDAYWTAIAVFGNIGKTTITKNTIYKNASSQSEGAAISVGLSPSGYFIDNAYNGTTLISENMINVSSANSAGILLLLYPKLQYHVPVPDGMTYEVSNNFITMNNTNTALACIGACSNTKWENNTVKGTGNYGIRVGKTIPSFAMAIQDVSANFPQWNYFEQNDLLKFTAAMSQVFVDQFAIDNTFAHNCYGDVKSPQLIFGQFAGALIQGDSNILGNEGFYGSYAKTKPVVVLDNGKAWPFSPYGEFASEDNYVRAFANGQLAACDQQVVDWNWELFKATTNTVSGCPQRRSQDFGSGRIDRGFKSGTPACLLPPPPPPRIRRKPPVTPGPPAKKH